MKKVVLWALPFAFLVACNNEASDSVEKADSANQAKLDSQSAPSSIKTDEESTNFLVKAADGGMSEVNLGELAQRKATSDKVKKYAAMLVHDHSEANDKVKSLAAQRNVTLPDSVSNSNKDKYENLNKKSGKDFDKAYISAMVDDHQNDIDMFKRASDKVNDQEVKSFVDNTLPKLQMHLDSAKAVQKAIK